MSKPYLSDLNPEQRRAVEYGGLVRAAGLRDEADQAVYVADVVLENREAGIPLKSQAIPYRTSHHSAALEIELTRRNVPFVKFGGLKFLEAAHIKDVLAVLRWAQNPRARIAGFRVLQLLSGVGPKTAARLLDSIGERDALNAIRAFEPPQATAAHWSEFCEIIRLLHGEFRRVARSIRTSLSVVWTTSRTHLRRCNDTPGRFGAVDADCLELPESGAIFD